MTTGMCLSLRVMVLLVIQSSSHCNQSCSRLEFKGVSDRVTALLGSVVNITFYLKTEQCSQNQTEHTIQVSNQNSQKLLCNFYVGGTCKQYLYHQVSCSCLPPKGAMSFSKKVGVEDNNTVYVWSWWHSQDINKKMFIFHIYSDTTQSTSKEVTSDAGIKTGEVKSHEWKSEMALVSDPKVVVIISATTCVCLVVMSVVVVIGVVCYKRASARYDRSQSNPDMNVAFAYLNYALQGVNNFRDQARDIYEEIPDPPKKYRRSRVGSSASSKSGVKLPPIPAEQENATTQGPMKEAQLSSDFDGYLHPALISDTTQLETREFRDNPTVQSS